LPPDTDKEEELMATISYDTKFYRAQTPSGRIQVLPQHLPKSRCYGLLVGFTLLMPTVVLVQPVSKKPPEPERVKVTPLPEEEEDPPGIVVKCGGSSETITPLPEEEEALPV